jgi:TolA-binding protein
MNHCQHLHGLSGAHLSNPQTRQHAQGCPACASILNAIEEMRSTVVYQKLPPSRALSIRMALRDSLEQPLRPEARSSLRFLWGVAALLVFAVWWLLPKQPNTNPLTDTTIAWVHIDSQPGALFSQESTATEELILLQRGTLELQVDAKKPSQRVKVRSQQGEELIVVQAHVFITAGYTFEEVSVKSGAVEFISTQGKKHLLGVGTNWKASAEPQSQAATTPQTVDAATLPVVTVEATPENKKSPRPNTSATNQNAAIDETAFQQGVAAQRAGKYIEAATFFAEGEKSPTLAQESAYFRTVALQKAGQLVEARTALQSFLAKYPSSSHTTEAHHLLAWMLLQENDLDGAELHFNAVVESGSKTMQESAQKGLAQLKTKREAKLHP